MTSSDQMPSFVFWGTITDKLVDMLILKRLGWGQFDPHPTPHPPPPNLCGFSKNVSSKERMKPWLFVTFNIIVRHIFPENFIEIPQVV